MPACARSGDSRPSAATTSRQWITGPPAIRTTAPSGPRLTVASLGANTAQPAIACSRAFSATRRLRASTIQPNGPACASAWSKCRNNGEAGRPIRPSDTRMSRIGQGANGNPSHTPACSSSARDPAAIA